MCTFTLIPGSIGFIQVVQAETVSANWQTVGTPGFSAGSVNNTKLLMDGEGTLYVGYQDGGNDYKPTLMKYTNQAWQAVGNPGFSKGSASFVSFALDPAGTPYVSYQDGANNYNATVMKYTSEGWQEVGKPATGWVNSTSLAINANGTPYIAYRDYAESEKVTVMKYTTDGGWQVVGTPGFTPGSARNATILLDPEGTPYVAYQDYTNGDKLTVMKYTGQKWEVVGSTDPTGETDWFSFVLDQQGTPYLAYGDIDNGYKATVKKYTDGSWELVGTPLSNGRISGISIAFNQQGIPYVAYGEGTNGYKASVKKFSNGTWQTVGTSNFSNDQIYYPSIGFDNNGATLVAYQDRANGGKATVMKFIDQQPSSAPHVSNVTVSNNPSSIPDTVTVNGLSEGDVVKVYNSETNGTQLGQSQPVTAGSTSATVTINQLGSNGGTIYVSVTGTGKLESSRVAVSYSEEDATAPSTSISVDPATPNGNNGWYNTPVSISLKAEDNPNGSGVSSTEYKINSEGAWNEYNGTFGLSNDGEYKINYQSKDKAGNAEEVQTLDLKLDTTAPETTASIRESESRKNFFNADVHVTLAANDNLSKVTDTQYSLDNGKTWNTHNGEITISAEGKNTLLYRSSDLAGNMEQPKSLEINIDKTDPTLDVTLDKTVLWSPNHKMVTINAAITSDDFVSGLESLVLTSITSNESLQPDDIQNANYQVPIKDSKDSFDLRAERLGNGNGRVYTITYTATDKAGNIATKTVTVTVPHDKSNK